MKNVYCVVTTKPWNIKLYNEFLKTQPNNRKWFLVTDHKLFEGTANTLKPRYIFFPHWSWVIPKSIWSNYESVVFHMTDLPYGRGPEPLQHLILAGKMTTKLTAIKVSEGMDTGPIYMQITLDLHGNAEEIYARCAEEVFDMIKLFVNEYEAGRPFTPVAQEGIPIIFKARTPDDNEIRDEDNHTLETLYDFTRMNDAETYPKTFLRKSGFRWEFTNAVLRHDCIEARVRIFPEGDNEGKV